MIIARLTLEGSWNLDPYGGRFVAYSYPSGVKCVPPMERPAKKARNGSGEFRSTPNSSRVGTEGTLATISSVRRCARLLTHETENDDDKAIMHTSESLRDIGVTELLEQDSRPTFIIDLQLAESGVRGRMNVVFCNKSLRFFDDLRNTLCAETFYPEQSLSSKAPTESTPDHGFSPADLAFKDWAVSRVEDPNDGYLPRHTFRDLFWTCSTLRNRWRVVSASQVPNQRRESHGTPSFSRAASRSVPSVTDISPSEDKVKPEYILPGEAKLSQKLADTESRFRVLTELNPVGMYCLSPDGTLEYANDMCKYHLST